ncbi:MAG: hypothetical protein J6C49_02220 [Elusimicrobiaceae bacterium]|nr:hypothetical protein [Elusimicrobiaceae bacterium]
MIDVSELRSGRHFFHAGIGELVFDLDATAELIGCTKANLFKIRGKGGLNPLKARVNRKTVYAQTDIEEYLARR